MSTNNVFEQNFLQPNNFRFVIKRLPNTSFYVKNVVLPGITMNDTAAVQTPFRTTHFQGDKLEFEDLQLTVNMDEDMNIYDEIMSWMVGLSYPNQFKEFADLHVSDDGLYSDATLLILTNGKNPQIEFGFEDIFPTSIAAVNMETTISTVEPVDITITFKINGMSMNRIG